MFEPRPRKPPPPELPTVQARHAEIAVLRWLLWMIDNRPGFRVPTGSVAIPEPRCERSAWRNSRYGWVYVAKASGMVKVGFSFNPQLRIAALRQEVEPLPGDWTGILQIRAEREAERSILRCLRRFKAFPQLTRKREYFTCTPEVEKLIELMLATIANAEAA